MKILLTALVLVTSYQFTVAGDQPSKTLLAQKLFKNQLTNYFRVYTWLRKDGGIQKYGAD